MHRRNKAFEKSIKEVSNNNKAIEFEQIFYEPLEGWNDRNILGEKCMNNSNAPSKKCSAKKVINQSQNNFQITSQFDKLNTHESWAIKTIGEMREKENESKKMSMFQMLKHQVKHLEREGDQIKKLPDFEKIEVSEHFDQSESSNQFFQPIKEEKKNLGPKRIRASSCKPNYRPRSLEKEKTRKSMLLLNTESVFGLSNASGDHSDLTITAIKSKFPQNDTKNTFRPSNIHQMGNPGFKKSWSQKKRQILTQSTEKRKYEAFHQKIQGRKLYRFFPTSIQASSTIF